MQCGIPAAVFSLISLAVRFLHRLSYLGIRWLFMASLRKMFNRLSVQKHLYADPLSNSLIICSLKFFFIQLSAQNFGRTDI